MDRQILSANPVVITWYQGSGVNVVGDVDNYPNKSQRAIRTGSIFSLNPCHGHYEPHISRGRTTDSRVERCIAKLTGMVISTAL